MDFGLGSLAWRTTLALASHGHLSSPPLLSLAWFDPFILRGRQPQYCLFCLAGVTSEMPVKARGPAEVPLALGAGIQPLLHVHTLVFEQSRGIGTRLATIPTRMGRELSTVGVVVGMLVALEMQGAVEALATVGADVRLPPRMGALVSIQVGGAPKALAAVPAGVGPLACVDASMSLPMGAPCKTEPTLPTVVRLIGGDVKPPVLS